MRKRCGLCGLQEECERDSKRGRGGGERRERFRECVLRRFQIQSRSTSSRYSSDGKEACGNLVFLNFGALSSIFLRYLVRFG